MKTNKIFGPRNTRNDAKPIPYFVILLTLVTASAVAQGTAFTYQGRLNDGANPANGMYEMQFSLHDAVANGNPVGTPVSLAPVAVSNGVFTVPLDFGSSAFTGAPRWLEITVNVYGSDRPTVILSPRQPITATPYAIRAANFSGTIADAQLSGNVARLDAAQTFIGPVQFTSPSNTFAGTFTGNGAAVTNVNLAMINSGGAIRETPRFILSSSPRVGSRPYAVIATDVNGDSHIDLISANLDADTLSVLLNDGSGSFTLGSSLATGEGPGSVVAADVNADGLIDLIAANVGENDDTLSVFTNSVGGRFTLVSSPAVGRNPLSIVSADVNGDGRVDLITANYGFAGGVDGTLSVLTNNGGGFTLASSLDVGCGARSVAAADVNSDRHTDLITLACGRLAVLTNNGSGGFTMHSSPGVGLFSVAVIAADVNGDGHTDLITANNSGNTLSVLINNGTGGFTLTSSPAVGSYPSSLAAADVNRDTHIDLISANSGAYWTLSVLTNDGTGGFTLASSPAVGRYPTSVAAADLNGDGNIDLISASQTDNTLAVLLNHPFTFVGNFGGDGSGLTGVNAGNLTGTIPEAILANAWRIGALRMERVSTAVREAQYSAESANLIAGSSINSVDAGVWGGTISGGGLYEQFCESWSVDYNTGQPECGEQSYFYYPNRVRANFGTVGGGLDNTSSGYAATVGGGSGNTSSNAYATVPGGNLNTAGGQYSFAAGRRAKALHDGSFVWADSVGADFSSTSNNQFLIRASVGVGINTNHPAGAALNVAGTVRAANFEGPIADSQLPSNIARLDENQTFSGPVQFANPSNTFAGTFTGDASGLTGLNAYELTGEVPSGSLGNAWKMGGNWWGTQPPILGTLDMDNQPLELIVGGERALRLDSIIYEAAGGYSWHSGWTPDGLYKVYSGFARSGVNIIGGCGANSVDAGIKGATIGGGGLASVDFTFHQCPTTNPPGIDDPGSPDDPRPPPEPCYITNYVSAPHDTRDEANRVRADFGTIGGGLGNTSSGYAATVSGGSGNTNSGHVGTISGGSGNTSSKAYATVPGGNLNTAGGAYSFAAGRRAKALHDGAFVWGDSTDEDIPSTASNQFTVRAAGGVRFFFDAKKGAGVELLPGGGSWSSLSDRNAKTNFAPANAREILDKVAALPLATWNYKAQDKAIRHIGPTAQDFRAAFGVGENDRTITTVDADGVALAAIQGLNQKLEEKETEIQELKRRLSKLEKLLNRE